MSQASVGGTGMVGLIVASIRNPFYADLAQGVAEVAHPTGLLPVIVGCDDDAVRQRELAHRLVERGVDGLIVTVPHDPEVLAMDVPLVAVDRCPGVPYVAVDGVTGARLAVRHLVRAGYERIGVLFAGGELAPVMDRVSGWRMALREHGHAIDEERKVECASFGHDDVAAGARRLLAAGVDAVFCINDMIAAAMLAAVSEAGLRAPQEVGVVGYDDTPMAAWPLINLTSVSQNTVEVGRTAARMLMQRMASPTLPVKPTMLTPNLVVRGTSRGPSGVMAGVRG